MGFRKKRDCTIYVAKTKAVIFAFVFAYAKSRFSHDAAHVLIEQSVKLCVKYYQYPCSFNNFFQYDYKEMRDVDCEKVSEEQLRCIFLYEQPTRPSGQAR